MVRLASAVLLVMLLAAVPAPAFADHDGATIPWTEALPPLPVGDPGADASERCGADGVVCIRRVERVLSDLAQHFGCDHRAVFATTYQLLTAELRRQLETDPQAFDDPAAIGLLAEFFLAMYLQALEDHAAGRPVPEAWRIALDANEHGDQNAGQDMVASINAHVQRDMPFAVEAVGLSTPDGSSRKPDHDRVNEQLSRAYDEIVPEIGDRFDPFMLIIAEQPTPADDVASTQMVAGWREGVWRNAERLANAQTDSHRDLVVASIEDNARVWAHASTEAQVPDYRTYRDAYCLARAAGASQDEAIAAAERAFLDESDPPAAEPGEDGPRPPGPPGDEAVAAPSATGSRPLPDSGGGFARPLVLALLVTGHAAWTASSARRRRHTNRWERGRRHALGRR